MPLAPAARTPCQRQALHEGESAPALPPGARPQGPGGERSTYASEDLDEPDCFVRYSVDTPELAIHRIRDEARDLLGELPEGEPRPVLGWADRPGRVRALGALYGGRTCGFSLRHGEGWSEWIVRPYLAHPVGPADSSAALHMGDSPCGVCVFCTRER
ncbi:hypothetical protein [Streptomyces sp. CA-146814]|uniref:hypothetical protein n=1 Tax=Streptomyces sp. CA-146814 TaxID=3240053 RepID=UPI003D8BF413